MVRMREVESPMGLLPPSPQPGAYTQFGYIRIKIIAHRRIRTFKNLDPRSSAYTNSAIWARIIEHREGFEPPKITALQAVALPDLANGAYKKAPAHLSRSRGFVLPTTNFKIK